MNQDEQQTRQRILTTAFRLFLARGYENTPVQAIIDAVGIAKGTFYHHFPSKDAMLVDLVQGMSRRIVEAIEPLVADPLLDARSKLLAMSRVASGMKADELGPESIVLVRQMRSKANRLLADSIQEISTQWLLPLYARCIRQGVAEGAFRVLDPDLAAELFLGAVLAMTPRTSDLFLEVMDGDGTAIDRLETVYAAMEQALERILSAPEGSLPIFTSIDIRALLAQTGAQR